MVSIRKTNFGKVLDLHCTPLSDTIVAKEGLVAWDPLLVVTIASIHSQLKLISDTPPNLHICKATSFLVFC